MFCRFATTRALSQCGARVLFTSRSLQRAQQAAERLQHEGAKACFWCLVPFRHGKAGTRQAGCSHSTGQLFRELRLTCLRVCAWRGCAQRAACKTQRALNNRIQHSALQGELLPMELELGDLDVVDTLAQRLIAEPRLDALILGESQKPAGWVASASECKDMNVDEQTSVLYRLGL